MNIYMYIYIYIFIYLYRRFGAVSPSLDCPGTRISIPIALAFACVRTCVRAKLRERNESAVAGGGQSN